VRALVSACVGMGVGLGELAFASAGVALLTHEINALPFCNLRPPWLDQIFDIISQTAPFSKKKVIEHKMCTLILSNKFNLKCF
jgi:hypothetical protein